MAGFTQIIPANTEARAATGLCLVLVQSVFGAPWYDQTPGDIPSATRSWQFAKHKHGPAESLPGNVAVPVYFSHMGLYGPSGDMARQYADWGHIVAWIPWAFGGMGGFLSSPTNWDGQQWFSSIAAIERAFNARYVGWAEDINGLRVAEPIATRDRRKPVAYITKDTNKRKAKQTLAAGKTTMLQFVERTTAITSSAGDFQIAAEVRVKGTAGTLVRLTAYRYIWDETAGKYTSKVYLNETDLTVKDNGVGYISFPIANRVPSKNERIGVEATVLRGKAITIDRYAAKGHQWDL